MEEETIPYMDDAAELRLIEHIEGYINEACDNSKYIHVCARAKSEGGMAYLVNRCIQMMAKDKIKLSSALASLESELEGIN